MKLFSIRILSEVKQLRQWPSLNGSAALELIRIDRAQIRSLPSHFCNFVPRLRSLYVPFPSVSTLILFIPFSVNYPTLIYNDRQQLAHRITH